MGTAYDEVETCKIINNLARAVFSTETDLQHFFPTLTVSAPVRNRPNKIGRFCNVIQAAVCSTLRNRAFVRDVYYGPRGGNVSLTPALLLLTTVLTAL